MSYRVERAMRSVPGTVIKEFEEHNPDMILSSEGEVVPIEQVFQDPLRHKPNNHPVTTNPGFDELSVEESDETSEVDAPEAAPTSLSPQEELAALIAAQEADMSPGHRR